MSDLISEKGKGIYRPCYEDLKEVTKILEIMTYYNYE